MSARYALLCLVYLLYTSRSSSQQYDLRTYSLEQGMPSATVNAICEDHDGYLWIGTNEGVTRTDGIHFETLGRAEGLPNDDITAIHCEENGPIWLGCRNGGLVVIQEERPVVISEGDVIAGTVNNIVKDASGTLWIATTQDGLWRYSKGELQKDHTPGSPEPPVHAMVIDAMGRPLAGGDHGLFLLHNGSWAPINSRELEGHSVRSLHADDQGVLIGTASGYVELDTALQTLPPAARFAGHFPITLPDRRITSIMRSRAGELWIGTPSGLAYLSKRSGQPTLRMISEANGLGHDLVNDLHQDRSGAIWCGTGFGGVSRFMSDAFMHFTDRDGLRSRIVSAIHRTPDGLLWMATMGGGLSVWDGHTLNALGRGHGLEDPYVLSLGEDREGHLLAGTASHGIYRWNGERFVHDDALSPAGVHVNVIVRDGDECVWIGHDQGLQRSDGYGNTMLHEIMDGVLDIDPGPDTTWIASGTGLYYLINNDRSRIERHPMVPAVPLYSITRDAKNNLWIGTDGKGLIRLNGSRIDSVTTEHNSMGSEHVLASNTVVSVLLDAYQNVWAGTRRGIHELELDV